MFTGIVQGKGLITAIADVCGQRKITVRLPENMCHHLQLGASIANNGCCLTITQIDGDAVSFDIMAETLSKTNLSQLKVGDEVNLERAARLGDEIGGHLMSGHIMTTTEITQIIHQEANRTIFFRLPENLKSYIFPKGFIGLDGCSLTIGEVSPESFNVHLIPETLSRTLFGKRQVGDAINLEIDPQIQAVVDTVRHYMDAQSATMTP
ncbi:MAG: riboflavin synthase subunit alpha [Neisseriaceae bacterium]|nr:riboflavin synthase subunit alpha [Neisseriaceae bacterium]